MRPGALGQFRSIRVHIVRILAIIAGGRTPLLRTGIGGVVFLSLGILLGSPGWGRGHARHGECFPAWRIHFAKSCVLSGRVNHKRPLVKRTLGAREKDRRNLKSF